MEICRPSRRELCVTLPHVVWQTAASLKNSDSVTIPGILFHGGSVSLELTSDSNQEMTSILISTDEKEPVLEENEKRCYCVVCSTSKKEASSDYDVTVDDSDGAYDVIDNLPQEMSIDQSEEYAVSENTLASADKADDFIDDISTEISSGKSQSYEYNDVCVTNTHTTNRKRKSKAVKRSPLPREPSLRIQSRKSKKSKESRDGYTHHNLDCVEKETKQKSPAEFKLNQNKDKIKQNVTLESTTIKTEFPSAMVNNDDGAVCLICETKFKKTYLMMAHVRSQHIDDPGLEKYLSKIEEVYKCFITRCPLCNLPFQGKHVVRHMNKKHKSHPDFKAEFNSCFQQVKIKISEECDAKDTWTKCPSCGRKFVSRHCAQNHWIHMCKENPDRKKLYFCSVCSFSSTDEAMCNEHKKTHVTSDFICELCGGGPYRNRNCLYLHNRRQHPHLLKNPNVKNFHCDVCTKVYVTKAALTKHRTRHSDAKNFQCEMCGKAFKNMHQVWGHQKTVHFDQYTYHCDKCGHGMNHRKYLLTHKCNRVKRGKLKGKQLRTKFGEGGHDEQNTKNIKRPKKSRDRNETVSNKTCTVLIDFGKSECVENTKDITHPQEREDNKDTVLNETQTVVNDFGERVEDKDFELLEEMKDENETMLNEAQTVVEHLKSFCIDSTHSGKLLDVGETS